MSSPVAATALDGARQTAWPHLLLITLLALSSVSGHALGAAWALFVLLGLWPLVTACKTSFQTLKQMPVPMLWLGVTLLAFAAKAFMTIYWHDSWQERHGEIRLLLGALATCGACAHWHVRPQEKSIVYVRLSHALSLSALLGLGWVIWRGRHGLPTHPIPWAGVMALTSCWLLAVGLDGHFKPAHRKWWLGGGFAALLAVLASQSRGAYAIAAWWLGVLIWKVWQQRHARPTWPQVSKYALAMLAALALLSQTPVLERTRQSLVNAASEVSHSLQAPADGANTSVGARMYMWQRSLAAVAQSPWLGHGGQGTVVLMQQWAQDAHSTEIASLVHVHNEYLQQWLEHGLPGLASQMAYVMGLLTLVVCLHRSGQTTASLALGGMWVMFSTGSLSNVNFIHNYYTTGLSLMSSLGMVLLARPAFTDASAVKPQ